MVHVNLAEYKQFNKILLQVFLKEISLLEENAFYTLLKKQNVMQILVFTFPCLVGEFIVSLPFL
jgi:hypothetical protein